MAKVKIVPLAPSIYCVHQRIALQIAAAVDADQPDWRNRLAAVIARTWTLLRRTGRAGLTLDRRPVFGRPRGDQAPLRSA